MSHRSTILALVLLVLAVLCAPLAFMFGGIGWMAQGGEGTLLVFLLGGSFALVALCIVLIRFLRLR